MDNAAIGKSKYVFGFFAELIATKRFTVIYVDFMIPGHTKVQVFTKVFYFPYFDCLPSLTQTGCLLYW